MEAVNDCQVKRDRIVVLTNENVESNTFLKENRDNFKKWLDENFKESNQDGSSVDVSDDTNNYRYSIDNDILKLKKSVKRGHRGMFGFGHPMEMMFDFMEMKDMQNDEVVYEGDFKPKKKETNLFPDLKNDLINRGEISTNIKKFIHEDRKVRIELQDKIENNKREIDQLEREIKNSYQEELKKEFSAEKLSELFKNKVTFVKGEKYNFNRLNGNEVKSITFKKETGDKYYLEFVFADDDEETLKIYKEEFKISKYIF